MNLFRKFNTAHTIGRSAAELKQQGAIEAAGNPNSRVSADDAQKKIV